MRFTQPSVAPPVSATITGGSIDVGTVSSVTNLGTLSTITNPIINHPIDAPTLLLNTNVVGGTVQTVTTVADNFASINLAIRFNGTTVNPPTTSTFQVIEMIWTSSSGSLVWVDSFEMLSADALNVFGKYTYFKIPVRGSALQINVTGPVTTNTDLIAWGSLRSVNSVIVQQDAPNFTNSDNIILSTANITLAGSSDTVIFGTMAPGPVIITLSGAAVSTTGTGNLLARAKFGLSNAGVLDLIVAAASSLSASLTSMTIYQPRRPIWFQLHNGATVSVTWNITVMRTEPIG